jgi:hypothetical protein
MKVCLSTRYVSRPCAEANATKLAKTIETVAAFIVRCVVVWCNETRKRGFALKFEQYRTEGYLYVLETLDPWIRS